MYEQITSESVSGFRTQLHEHPVYRAVSTIDDLRCFMEHHVYSVWDFMSLIKYLQSVVAPTRYPWVPGEDASVQRFINELVLEEESDENLAGDGHSSHFVLYLQAMEEVGADTGPVCRFVARVRNQNIADALHSDDIPAPARLFTQSTFDFIESDKPHRVAAALALGREHIIPGMFRAILQSIGVGERQAPSFHVYLRRHIQLDEDFHAPLSLRLLNGLCGGDEARRREAIAAAEQAVAARLTFWDGVQTAIRDRRALSRTTTA